MADYHAPSPDAPFLFGDILSSGWLHDAVLTGDAVALRPFTRRGGATAYEPMDSGHNTGRVLAHGGPCRAILISDDCEIETWTVRHPGRGRIHCAAVTPWPTDPDDRGRAPTSCRRYALAPDLTFPPFGGGIVELQRMFSVSSGSLHKQSRVASLSNEVRARLEQRWAAYATRRGPYAVLDQADKLARLLTAGGDRDRLDRLAIGEDQLSASGREGARLFARVIGHTWRLEGELMNPVVNAYERRRPAPAEVSRMVAELSDLSVTARRAADALRGYASGDGPTG